MSRHVLVIPIAPVAHWTDAEAQARRVIADYTRCRPRADAIQLDAFMDACVFHMRRDASGEWSGYARAEV